MTPPQILETQTAGAGVEAEGTVSPGLSHATPISATDQYKAHFPMPRLAV